MISVNINLLNGLSQHTLANGTQWSGSNVELKKITQANKIQIMKVETKIDLQQLKSK